MESVSEINVHSIQTAMYGWCSLQRDPLSFFKASAIKQSIQIITFSNHRTQLTNWVASGVIRKCTSYWHASSHLKNILQSLAKEYSLKRFVLHTIYHWVEYIESVWRHCHNIQTASCWPMASKGFFQRLTKKENMKSKATALSQPDKRDGSWPDSATECRRLIDDSRSLVDLKHINPALVTG